MNWIFWVLLAVTLLLLLTPVIWALPPQVDVVVWLVGSLFLLAIALWVVAAVARPEKTTPKAT